MTDAEAIELIYKALDGVEWSPDTLEEIGQIITATGRVIHDPNDECPAGGPHRYVYLTTYNMGPGRYQPSGMYCDECHAPAPERDDL